MAEAKKKPAAKAKKTDKEVAPVEAVKTKVAKKAADNKEVVETEAIVETPAEKTTAKAGKRSAKATKEAEEKQAKEERKAHAADTDEADKPKKIVQPARSKLERRSKNYRKSVELIEDGKLYTVAQALDLSTKTSSVKFDATVELHVNLGVDPRQADQNVRDIVVLPAGTGKTVRIAVLADADDAAKAKKAGADIAGGDEFLQQLDKGEINFDTLIATPSMMPKLGKYARILGPKGLMPNPKSGTVTTDVTKAISEAKAGRVEYRVDSTGIIHVGVGKVSFGADKLRQNTQAILASIKGNKPSSLKSSYIKSVFVTTTMGPSIAVDLGDVNS